VYRPGDYVYPVDLPQRWLCRVARVDSARAGDGLYQILTLQPLEGPWCTFADMPELVRFDADVQPAGTRALWAEARRAPAAHDPVARGADA